MRTLEVAEFTAEEAEAEDAAEAEADVAKAILSVERLRE